MTEAQTSRKENAKRVLIIDRLAAFAGTWRDAFEHKGWQCHVCIGTNDAFDVLSQDVSFDVIVSELHLGRRRDEGSKSEEGFRFYRETIQIHMPLVPVLFYTTFPHGDAAEQIQASPSCVLVDRLTTSLISLVEIANALPRRFARNKHASEQLFQIEKDLDSEFCRPVVIDTRTELLKYFARHPEKMIQMSPKQFEELVSDILREIGFVTETTKATRDGGVDIYAYFRNQVCSFLMIVECKRWSPDRHVGIEIVQRLYGVQQTRKANKAMIVTTSFFSDPAKEEVRGYPNLMELKDYNNLRQWLEPFR